MQVNYRHNFGERECPACACVVPVNNNRCPICGHAFLVAPPSHRWMKFGGGLLMLLLLVWMLLR